LYSYDYFKSQNLDIDIIEVAPKSESLNRSFMNFLDKYISKITKISISLDQLSQKNIITKIYNSDVIIATNHGLGISLCLLLKLKKIKDKKVFFINAGMFEKKTRNVIYDFFYNLIINLAINFSEKIIFTSHKEFQYGIKRNQKNITKFASIPFCVDTNFWNPEKINFSEKEGILFVGNNEYRDIDCLLNIAKELKEIKFTALTTLIDSDIKVPDNLEIIQGDLNKNLVDDLEVKKLYQNARLTIIPVKNCLVQSSGHSVSLQSLAMGTPVVINKFGGFWEDSKDAFEYGYTIVDNSIQDWIKKILEIYYDEKKFMNKSTKGMEYINKKLNFDIFNEKMKSLIIN